MKKNIIAVLLLVTAIAFTACAQTRKTGKKNGKQPAITYVSIERTGCFGRCPSYIVEVMPTGLVRYTGKMFAEYQGVYEKQMPVAQVNELYAEVAKYRVDTCKDMYDVMIPDLPGMHMDITYNSVRKHIQNAGFGPAFLKGLALQVDELAKVDNTWKRIGDAPTPNNR